MSEGLNENDLTIRASNMSNQRLKNINDTDHGTEQASLLKGQTEGGGRDAKPSKLFELARREIKVSQGQVKISQEKEKISDDGEKISPHEGKIFHDEGKEKKFYDVCSNVNEKKQ